MVNNFERRNDANYGDIGYRETDKNQIKESNMKFLSPVVSTDLYKVISKINQQHIPVYSLSKSELNTLFYGHIFTSTVNPDGSKRLSEEDMKVYSEIMSECYYKKYSDVEMFIYQQMKDMGSNDTKEFQKKIEKFRTVNSQFEGILGRRDKI